MVFHIKKYINPDYYYCYYYYYYYDKGNFVEVFLPLSEAVPVIISAFLCLKKDIEILYFVIIRKLYSHGTLILVLYNT